VTDGGGAVIVTSVERARDLRQKPAVIAGLGQVHSSEIIRPWDDGRGGGREAAEAAYRMAGCSAPDIDVVQLYDGFTPLVMHELVAMNMAIDEALLETAVVPTIRFYRWRSPALSFGYLESFPMWRFTLRSAI